MAVRKVKKRAKMSKQLLFAIVTGVLAIVFIVATAIMSSLSGAVNVALNIQTYEIKNDGDIPEDYFKKSFTDEAELRAYGDKLVEEVLKEGAILMKNKNNVLPLKTDAKVSIFSTSSVNLLHAGLGSGKVDSSKAPTMKKSFEDAGMSVNPSLWDFFVKKEHV